MINYFLIPPMNDTLDYVFLCFQPTKKPKLIDATDDTAAVGDSEKPAETVVCD